MNETNNETYELLNKALHRMAREINYLVKEKKENVDKTQKHIETWEIIREEILQLAEKIGGD